MDEHILIYILFIIILFLYYKFKLYFLKKMRYIDYNINKIKQMELDVQYLIKYSIEKDFINSSSGDDELSFQDSNS